MDKKKKYNIEQMVNLFSIFLDKIMNKKPVNISILLIVYKNEQN